jgi:chaperonin GroES
MTAPTIKPLGSRLLVRRQAPDNLSENGLIYIPDNAQERSQRATVLTLGDGKFDPDGKPFSFTVRPGDEVLIGKFNGTPVVPGDDDHVLIYERDILGIFNYETPADALSGLVRARQLSGDFRDALIEAAAVCDLPEKPLLMLSEAWLDILSSFSQEELEAFAGTPVPGGFPEQLFGFDLLQTLISESPTGFELVSRKFEVEAITDHPIPEGVEYEFADPFLLAVTQPSELSVDEIVTRIRAMETAEERLAVVADLEREHPELHDRVLAGLGWPLPVHT